MAYSDDLIKWAARRAKIIAMAKRKGPNSYNIVARSFGISRQRVQQIMVASQRVK